MTWPVICHALMLTMSAGRADSHDGLREVSANTEKALQYLLIGHILCNLSVIRLRTSILCEASFFRRHCPHDPGHLIDRAVIMIEETIFYICIGMIFVFAFVNGFHDGGNVIASIICSRSIRPLRALALACMGELLGPLLLGTAVAVTMSSNILKPEMLETLSKTGIYILVGSAVGSAIFWKLPTWYLGIPSSGSHALLGGMVGAGIISLGEASVSVDKVLVTVVIPMLTSPLIGIILGYIIFSMIRTSFRSSHRGIGRLFTVLQKPTVIFLAATHGSNDAQKSMGLISIALAAGSGEMHGGLPLPFWAILGCAVAISSGLAFGGWRIVKTVGFGICRMEPVHSFSSQLASTGVILSASMVGFPVSTTQIIASSVMGVGASRRLSGVRWSAAANIAYAWLLTFPVCSVMGAGLCWLLNKL